MESLLFLTSISCIWQKEGDCSQDGHKAGTRAIDHRDSECHYRLNLVRFAADISHQEDDTTLAALGPRQSRKGPLPRCHEA